MTFDVLQIFEEPAQLAGNVGFQSVSGLSESPDFKAMLGY